MSKLPKPPRRGPTKADLARYARVSRVRDKTLRAVGVEKAPIPDVNDSFRQTIVLLYHEVILSVLPEHDVATEFFRCFQHLIEGGTVDTMPLTFIDRSAFKAKLKHAIESGHILSE